MQCSVPKILIISENQLHTSLEEKLEPKLTKPYARKASRGVKYITQMLQDIDEGEEEGGGEGEGGGGGAENKEDKTLCSRTCNCCCSISLSRDFCQCFSCLQIPNLTPRLQRARNRGYQIAAHTFFPALPKLMQHVWVFLELCVTLAEFGILIAFFSLDSNKEFVLVTLVLKIISVILALIDGFFYFTQMTFVAQCHQRITHNSNSQGIEGELEMADVENQSSGARRRCCNVLSSKQKAFLSTYFEIGRNVLSEVILYPIIICDIIDLITGGSLTLLGFTNRLGFSFFLVGAFYFFLSVYFVRTFMVIASMITLRQTPIDASNMQDDYIGLFTRFTMHTLAQILSHGLILIAVALKIHQENPVTGVPLSISPSLWLLMITGGLLPLLGIMSFFFVNYFWVEESSIGFYMDMMSLLEGESFAALVFEGEGKKVAREKAEKLSKSLNLIQVKKELNLYHSKSKSWAAKVLHPLKNPFFLIVGLTYYILLLTFIGMLVLSVYSTDNGGLTLEFEWFNGNQVLGVSFALTALLILVSNIHLILLINLWLVFVVIGGLVSLIVAVFYCPIGVLILLVERVHSRVIAAKKRN